jgi:hypothetical protein
MVLFKDIEAIDNGARFHSVDRYVRNRGCDIEVKAKEDRSITDVPVDAFRIEYFGQGELAKVAEDPLKNPELLQAFLDRHTSLRDLTESEQALSTNLRENAARLNPLETAFGQLTAKKESLGEIEKKLLIAEEGNLRDVVGMQSKLASEKAIRESVEAIATEYTNGWTLANIQRSFDQILMTAGSNRKRTRRWDGRISADRWLRRKMSSYRTRDGVLNGASFLLTTRRRIRMTLFASSSTSCSDTRLSRMMAAEGGMKG